MGEPAVEFVGNRRGIVRAAFVQRSGADLADPGVAGIDGRAERVDAGGDETLLRGARDLDDRAVVVGDGVERFVVEREEE